MSGRPTGWDWVVVALLTLLSVLAPRAGGPVQPQPQAAWVGTVGLGLAVMQGVPLAWRRLRPVEVAVFVVLAYGAYGVLVDPVPPYAGWVALFAVTAHVPGQRRAAVTGGVVAAGLAAAAVAAALVHPEGRSELPTLLLVTLIVLLAGAATRAERGRLSALRDRAALLEREQDAVRGQAVLEERLRIARDMHDWVGHGLSAIAVQSGTARVALEAGDLSAARTALGNVEASSRDALREMRILVGVLREPSPTPAVLTPGLADVPALVEQVRNLGVTVALKSVGNPDQVPSALAECAYRVIQEALTNVVRHAPGAAATVRLDVGNAHLLVEVTDAGGAARVSESAPGGHGLVGMRERVELLHGTLEAGPSDGGWRVCATLPVGDGRHQ